MPNQTRGTTTNLAKLVSWDIDDYALFNDEDGCLVCLTPRDMYLLRNCLRQMQWETRWTSEVGTEMPDIQTIAEDLGFKMSQAGCVDLCAEIVSCINDPESGVSQAIINTVVNSTSIEIIDSGQGQSGLIFGEGNNPTCDFDILWGGINHLVDQMDTNNLDALQILEVLTNVNEWVTEVLAGVLGVEAPIIQSALEWGLFIQDNILENYEAQITTAYMDTIKCGLFCIAKDNNCELTAQQLVDYFFERLSSQLTFGSLLNESLEFLVLGTWSGSEIADAMMLSQLVFRAQFGRWFENVAFRSIDLDMRLGFNDPSDDWELLCDCGWTETWLDGNGSPVVDGWTLPFGVYDAGNDRLTETEISGSTDGSHARYEIPIGKSGKLTRISIDYDNLNNGTDRNQRIAIFDELDVLVDDIVINNGTTTATLTWTGDVDFIAGYEILCQVTTAGTLPNHSWNLKITVSGEGDNPFV